MCSYPLHRAGNFERLAPDVVQHAPYRDGHARSDPGGFGGGDARRRGQGDEAVIESNLSETIDTHAG